MYYFVCNFKFKSNIHLILLHYFCFKIVLLVLFIVIISVLYYFLIIYLVIGFDRVSVFNLKKEGSNQQFSIIIPFRNEAKNIIHLINSLSQINYNKTKFEILFIDDDSTDDTVNLLNPYLLKNKHWKLINNQRKSNSPKKDAINTAIQYAKYEWIITTDADCEVNENWLQSFGEYITQKTVSKNNKEPHFIAGPVAYKTNKSLLQNFQNMDFLSLIGSTIGAFGNKQPFLCNGANLCYKKETFLAVDGFTGNDNIASGDDVFLMEKMLNKYPNSVSYLKSKEVIVTTSPKTTFKGLLDQRIRWASKTSASKNWFGKFVGMLVFLMNLMVTCSLIFIIYKFTFSESHEFINVWNLGLRVENLCLIVFGLKFIVDLILIQKTYKFIGLKNRLTYYTFSSILYPFFVVIVVFLSFFKRYEWKGRTFNK